MQCLGPFTLTRDGQCLSTCPGDDVELGDANKGRFCTAPFQCRHWLDRLADGTRCKCADGCKTCTYRAAAVTCDACFTNVFKQEDECVADCADGTYGLASSLTGGLCVEELVCSHWVDTLPDGSRCRCSENCLECRYRGSEDLTCELCGRGTFLYAGACVAACPAGTTASGDSLKGEACLPNSL